MPWVDYTDVFVSYEPKTLFMKRMLFLMLFFASMISLQAQPTTTETPSLKTDYLTKSKKQKTAAIVLVAGGGILTSIAAVISTREVVEDFASIFTGEETKKSAAVPILGIAGLAAMGGSIPLFIAASRNKRKAREVSAFFKMETQPFIHQQSIGRIPFPALSVKLRF